MPVPLFLPSSITLLRTQVNPYLSYQPLLLHPIYQKKFAEEQVQKINAFLNNNRPAISINNAFGGSVDGDGNPLSWADGQPPVLNHLSDAELQSGLTIGIYGWVCFSNEIIDLSWGINMQDTITMKDMYVIVVRGIKNVANNF